MTSLYKKFLSAPPRNFAFRFSLITGFALSSCSHLAQIDREDLNRKIMDLSLYQKTKSAAPLTQLNGLSAEGQSAGCSVCAH